MWLRHRALIQTLITDFIVMQVAPLHVCYMFRLFIKPPSDISIQKCYTGRRNKIKSKGPLVQGNVLKCSNIEYRI
jgi:hypothetical protein